MMTWMENARVKKVRNQIKMKMNYDKKEKDRHFKVGDRVLVFLPEGGGKFEAKWQGPYFVTKKLGDAQFFLGHPVSHTVGSGQIKPNFDKIKAVKQFPKPETKKDVRSFLGLSGYYRKFVRNYEDNARPLIDLKKKKQPNKVIWTPQCETAFENLKTYLSREPILKAPDFNKQFLLQTDASKKATGAILSQLDDQF